MERPTCGSCRHFLQSSGGPSGECHGVPPAVVMIENEAKTVWPEVRNEYPGCPNHKDADASADTAIPSPSKPASGLREDGQRHLTAEQIRQRFPCGCVRLGPAFNQPGRRIRLEIPGDTRIITALRVCRVCGGSGVPRSADEVRASAPGRPSQVPSGPAGWDSTSDDLVTLDREREEAEAAELDRAEAERLAAERQALDRAGSDGDGEDDSLDRLDAELTAAPLGRDGKPVDQANPHWF